MKWLNDSRVSLKLLIFMAVMVMVNAQAFADFTFGEPENMGPTLNTSSRDEEPGISSDGLSIYFCSQRPGGYGGYDMYVTTRATEQDEWGPPVNLGPTVNSSSDDFSEDISADGLELYFGSNRPGSSNYDIWVAKRATIHDDWTTPINLGSNINSSSWEGCPSISDDGLELYFWTNRPGGAGGYDIWVSRRDTKQDEWGPAMNVGPPINSSSTELCMDITSDGLVLIFVSARQGSYGGDIGDLWMSRWSEIDESWGTQINLGPEVNTSGDENGPCISSDGSMLYYSSNRPGGSGGADMWQIPIIPIVDFNGDGVVDIDDLIIMIENWGTGQSLCDIGPMPWGDGIVDRADLEVLMEYWQQLVDVAAHWKLDETEGNIAYDSSGYHYDANVIGDPNWQPYNGMIDGAIELDGINDYISTPFTLNPGSGSFSVFAWIKGGLPGQVIFSQADGVNWLSADSLDGCLMTELMAVGGRTEQQPLISSALITDGGWHRIGFVWDDTNRILYVDDIEAASDTQPHLAGSEGNLYIGVGNDFEPGTFWSGLIDDVRVYKRAVTP